MALSRSGRPVGQIRESEVEARRNAFTGARLAITENISMEAAAERVGSNRSSVQEIALVMQFGTPEEIAACETGTLGPRRICDAIRERTTPEERRRQYRKPPPRVVPDAQFEAQTWANLREAIELITSMPAAADVVAIVRKNPQRRDYISRKALLAQTWLEEFVNAWTE